jgi:hypothetical protein
MGLRLDVNEVLKKPVEIRAWERARKGFCRAGASPARATGAVALQRARDGDIVERLNVER